MKRKYTLDETYFDVIDTEEKAYILGLLYADGYNNQKRGNVVLGLQERDLPILNVIRKAIKTNKPIYLTKAKNERHQNTCTISISSRLISNRLAELGCYQAKSTTLKFPTKEQVPDHLIRHFIRGYFDGDGSFSEAKLKTGRTQIQCSIVGTKSFCESVREIVREIGCGVCFSTKPNSKISYMAILSPRKFMNWIYEDCTIFLSRKNKKFKDSISVIDQRRQKNMPDIEAFGESKNLNKWSLDPRCKISYNSLYNRIKNGMTLEEAISVPKMRNNQKCKGRIKND